MDVISDILRLLELRASVYFHSHFCGSWAVDGANDYRATFHLVARGNGWVHLSDEGRDIALTGGDLIVMPRPVAHSISGSAQAPEHIEGFPPAASADDATIRLVCGYFDFSSPQANPLLEAMPDVVIIRNEDPSRPPAMAQLLQDIARETESDAPGADVVVERLSAILFIQVVRAFMQQGEVHTGVLAALADDKLARAVQAVHEDPGARWSVEGLATVAGMSRSAFAKRFQEVAGMGPMQYVTQWRMQTAYELLRTTQQSVSQVADTLGYSAEASFRKAFKQQMGVGPGVVRKSS